MIAEIEATSSFQYETSLSLAFSMDHNFAEFTNLFIKPVKIKLTNCFGICKISVKFARVD